MRPENPYEKEHCNWCGKPLSDCYDNLCEDLQDCIKEDAWDEGYNACANQPISEQEGWQTDEPSKEEGPFLLDLGNKYKRRYRLADEYISETPYRESVFRSTTSFDFPYTFFKSVKRWKLI